MRFWLILAGLLLFGGAMAQQPRGDAVAGRDVAMRLCAGCHAVAEGQVRNATDAAPPFIVLARNPTITELSLPVFLKTPHARMPSVGLSPKEITDITSYVLSLRTNN